VEDGVIEMGRAGGLAVADQADRLDADLGGVVKKAADRTLGEFLFVVGLPESRRSRW